MPTFSRYDVVSVPFPYTDRAAFERRPALVVSDPMLDSRFGLLWVLMITAAENRAWDSDVPIPDHLGVGLSIPSIIRPTKIATVEASRARKRGRVSEATAALVADAVSSIIC
ncbi:MAG TPA: type II toxin-antitoxin system PemK/MazF family toxin [Stellaceae bacterium]|jgi:mRNA interferase MazF